MLFSVQTKEDDGREAEQLLCLVGRGNRDAFSRLYALTRSAVYAQALSLLCDAHEAQDVAQDTFVKVWESAPDYRPQGAPMAWLLTIARNLAISRLRLGRRLVELDDTSWNALPAVAPSVPYEDRQLLQETLRRLGGEERQIILLHAVTGLKHREIAQLLGLPLSTVLSKYHRGLSKMRVLMKGESDR